MSTVDPSTQEPEVKKSRGLWSPRPGRIWIPACGPNVNHSLLRCEVSACVAIASSKPFSNQVAVVGTQSEPRYDCSNRLHGNHRNGCGLIVEVSAETT